MKVYELIRELSKFEADTEVNFHINTSFESCVNVTVDLGGEEKQDIQANVDFDEDLNYSDIDDNESYRKPYITINLEF